MSLEFDGNRVASVTADLSSGMGPKAWMASDDEMGLACGFVKVYIHREDALALAGWILGAFGEPHESKT